MNNNLNVTLESQSSQPRISVVVPVFNSEATLEACLKSIRSSLESSYELIVVNDASSDSSESIARRFADRVINHRTNRGLAPARITGLESSNGPLLLYVDSDVIIPSDAVSRAISFFGDSPDVGAFTGILGKFTPDTHFLSQYKNLYMNFNFSKLPNRVTFLYGSIIGVRREVAERFFKPQANAHWGEDTAKGQNLYKHGIPIAFERDFEVTHLKRYSFGSFVRNDFNIPFHWAKLFVCNAGWKEIFKSSRFAHASAGQLLSVILVPTALTLSVFALLGLLPFGAVEATLASWFCLNARFHYFLAKERGVFFATLAVVTTLFDQLLMATGILCGFVSTALVFVWESVEHEARQLSHGANAQSP